MPIVLVLGFTLGGLAAIYFSTYFPKTIGWLIATAGLVALFFAWMWGKLTD